MRPIAPDRRKEIRELNCVAETLVVINEQALAGIGTPFHSGRSARERLLPQFAVRIDSRAIRRRNRLPGAASFPS